MKRISFSIAMVAVALLGFAGTSEASGVVFFRADVGGCDPVVVSPVPAVAFFHPALFQRSFLDLNIGVGRFFNANLDRGRVRAQEIRRERFFRERDIRRDRFFR